MLASVSSLSLRVLGPLKETCGPTTRLLTVEVHGDHVHGLAMFPGKVVKYVLNAQSNSFKVFELLTLIK